MKKILLVLMLMGLWRLLRTQAARLILGVSLPSENLYSSALTIASSHKRCFMFMKNTENLGCN